MSTAFLKMLAATVRLDVQLQSRSRLYTIGVAVAVLLGLAGRFAFGPEHAGRVLTAFYILAIGGTSYMFAAATVLLEKSDGTLAALRTTPLTLGVYLTSKALTLTGFAAVESGIVYAVGFFGAPISLSPVLLGVVCLGSMYTFLALGQVAAHDSVFGFLIPDAALVSAALQTPVFFLIDLGPSWLWYLVPTQGPLLLMLSGSEPLTSAQMVYAVMTSLGATGMSAWWARRRFVRHVGLQVQ